MSDSKGTVADRINFGFRLVLARKPTAAELAHLVELYGENLERYRGDPTAAKAMAGRGVVAISIPVPLVTLILQISPPGLWLQTCC